MGGRDSIGGTEDERAAAARDQVRRNRARHPTRFRQQRRARESAEPRLPSSLAELTDYSYFPLDEDNLRAFRLLAEVHGGDDVFDPWDQVLAGRK